MTGGRNAPRRTLLWARSLGPVLSAATRVATLAFILGLALAMPACGSHDPLEPAELGEEFVLERGQAAVLRGGELVLRFVQVVKDGRCPEGVVCFWAGDAEVEIQARASGAGSTSLLLHTAPGVGDGQEASVYGFRVRLTALAPGPRVGRPAPATYWATLIVTLD
jgi:hypothetical protein